MSSRNYDHEQQERDHYNRKNEKNLRHCISSFKFLLILTATIFIGMLLFSCASIQGPIAEPFGVVITAERDLIQVAHKVVNKVCGSQIIGVYYVPGHTYEVGDRFPDLSKYEYPFPIKKGGSNE
jgi:hypothetical protein